MEGLETFKQYFQEYKDHYVLIGGAACDIIFSEEEDLRSERQKTWTWC